MISNDIKDFKVYLIERDEREKKMIALGSFLFGLPKLNHPKLKRTYERKCLTIFWTKLPTLTFNFSYTFSVILFSASFVFLLIGFFCSSFRFFFFFFFFFIFTEQLMLDLFFNFCLFFPAYLRFFFLLCAYPFFSQTVVFFFFGFLNLFF